MASVKSRLSTAAANTPSTAATDANRRRSSCSYAGRPPLTAAAASMPNANSPRYHACATSKRGTRSAGRPRSRGPSRWRSRRPGAATTGSSITAHDGFTLHDLVTYGSKHNEDNGERNQDGSDDNQSWHHGVEGETDDAEVVALRDRQKLNMLATLLLSQGVPMLLGGDEMGRTQRGNNNAYCQDNELSWFDWQLDDRRKRLLDQTCRLIALRRKHPVLQHTRFLTGEFIWHSELKDMTWLRSDGEEMNPEDWQRPWIASIGLMLGGDAIRMLDEKGQRVVGDGLLVLMNAHHEPVTFSLPEDGGGTWLLELDTADTGQAADTPCAGGYQVGARALALFRQPLDAAVAREAKAAPARVLRRETPGAAAARAWSYRCFPSGPTRGGGSARFRTSGDSRRGRRRRFLGRAGPAGQRSVGSRPEPVRRPVGVRARPRLPVV